MGREERVAGGIGLIALVYMIAAWRLPRFALTTTVVDAHVFPLTLGGILLLLSLLYFLQARRVAPKSGTEKPLLDGVNRPVLFQLVGANLLYALILSALGYLVSTILFIASALLILGQRRWGLVAALSVGFAGITYFLFAYLLQVPLARGILPF